LAREVPDKLGAKPTLAKHYIQEDAPEPITQAIRNRFG
jgi:hypothetical protein